MTDTDSRRPILDIEAYNERAEIIRYFAKEADGNACLELLDGSSLIRTLVSTPFHPRRT